MPAGGLWVGRLSQVGQSDWFSFPVRANRTFTVVTQAIDETGAPTESKAMPSIGVWDAFDPIGSTAIGAAPGLNGDAPGETWLQVASSGADIVRIGIADLRGDGRPDYAYNGWVLYADTVQPQILPAFRRSYRHSGHGLPPLLTRCWSAASPPWSPASRPMRSPPSPPPRPPASPAPSMSKSTTCPSSPPPPFALAAVSYDSGTGDALSLVTAPAGTVPMATPIPFTVAALGPNLAPVGGVTVIYTVTSGAATLGCGLSVCSVTATGDGLATINVTAVNTLAAVVTASLTNGSNLLAHFTGGTPPALASLTPQLSLAAGATFTWTVQALVLSGTNPAPGQSVAWQATAGSGIVASKAPRPYQRRRHRHRHAHRRSARRGTNRHHQRLSQWNQPMRRLHRLRFAPGVRHPSARLRHNPDPRPLRNPGAHRPPPSRHGRRTPWPAAPSPSIKPSTPGLPPAPRTRSATQGALLGAQSATAVSALDGTVTFTPAILPGVPTNLLGLAASGNTATAQIAIQQQPK